MRWPSMTKIPKDGKQIPLSPQAVEENLGKGQATVHIVCRLTGKTFNCMNRCMVDLDQRRIVGRIHKPFQRRLK